MRKGTSLKGAGGTDDDKEEEEDDDGRREGGVSRRTGEVFLMCAAGAVENRAKSNPNVYCGCGLGR
jgi:hypothetical protein